MSEGKANLIEAYSKTVEWFQHFENQLRNPELNKPAKLEMLAYSIDSIIGISNIENSESGNMMALLQIIGSLETCRNNLMKSNDQAKESSKYDKAILDCKVVPKINGLNCMAGYDDVKKELKSIVILPLRQPQLYIGCAVSKSILLYGPPGTGKTQMAHAIAAEANADIYCITAGSIMSSYIGETEKMVMALFTWMKNVSKTSILFIDEIDGLCRKRNDDEKDHNRRLKTELLCQLSDFNANHNAFLICATNCPWELDSAFIRRFQKRIYVPLPNDFDRLQLLKHFTMGTLLNMFPHWEELLHKTDGYSSSDLQALVSHALMKPIMELADVKIWTLGPDNFYRPYDKSEQVSLECMKFCSLEELPEKSVQCREVNWMDLLDATHKICKTVPYEEIVKFNGYQSSYK